MEKKYTIEYKSTALVTFFRVVLAILGTLAGIMVFFVLLSGAISGNEQCMWIMWAIVILSSVLGFTAMVSR